MQLRRLAAIAAMDDDDWSVAVSILTRSRKRRRFAIWRDEEKGTNIVAGPDYFRVPPVDLTQFPPPPPPPLDEWRFDQQARNRWDETLSSRIDEQQSVIDAMATVVSATEEVTLPELRDALIKASGKPGGEITQRYQIDAAAGGCQKTTRVSQAIRSLQGLLFALRNGDLQQDFPGLSIIDPIDFDAKWRWLGSYATWRAAMFVFLYPENILIPTLRRRQSPAFQQLVQTSRSPGGLTPDNACEAARAYVSYFCDLFRLNIVATCQTDDPLGPPGQCSTCSLTPPSFNLNPAPRLYVFALSHDKQRIYWSSTDGRDETAQYFDFWRQIDGVSDVVSVLGVSPYRSLFSDQRFLLLFYLKHQLEKTQLCLLRYDILTRHWDTEPTILDLPKNSGIVVAPPDGAAAVLTQTMSEYIDPHIAVQYAWPEDIYDNYLSVEHMNWRREWRVIYTLSTLPAYPARGTLRALLDNGDDSFWVFLGDNNGTYGISLAPNYIPVFRLKSGDDEKRFMTIDPDERDQAVQKFGRLLFVCSTVPPAHVSSRLLSLCRFCDRQYPLVSRAQPHKRL